MYPLQIISTDAVQNTVMQFITCTLTPLHPGNGTATNIDERHLIVSGVKGWWVGACF